MDCARRRYAFAKDLNSPLVHEVRQGPRFAYILATEASGRLDEPARRCQGCLPMKLSLHTSQPPRALCAAIDVAVLGVDCACGGVFMEAES